MATRFLITHKESDLAAFKTPDLRKVLGRVDGFDQDEAESKRDELP
jgi:hypothetical protein